MKKHFLNSICFPICVFAALTIPYRAAAADAPSVEVQITPDKASYAQGDCPTFDVAVINHNDYDISDLTLNATASDAIHLTENAEYATDLVTATEGGKAHFDSNMAQLKKAFENSLMPGESRVITSAGDASITAWNLQGSLLNSNEADGWLSLNKCNAVIVAEGSFDGTTYTAKVNYYVVDRYDFYEPNPTDGAENEVGFVTNDGYVLLSYYDYAEPFDVVGYYTTTISWTK